MKVLQLHLTLKCDENCAWCAYRGYPPLPLPRGDGKKNSELSIYQIITVLFFGRESGADILKISGGGEPTLHPYFLFILKLAKFLGYKVYLQTHGKRLTEGIMLMCDDVRVSHGDGKSFIPPPVKPHGFSYVVSRQPDYQNLTNLIKYALTNSCYVRITQDDTDLANIPTIEEIKSHLRLGVKETLRFFKVDLNHKPKENTIQAGTSEANRLSGFGFNLRFWDALDYHQGKNPCPCYDSPLFTPSGWFPCCKTHVAKGLVTGYNQTMALGKEYPQVPYDGSNCRRCYY